MNSEEIEKIKRFGKNMGFSPSIIDQAISLGDFRKARNYLKNLYLRRAIKKEFRSLPVVSPKPLSIDYILNFMDNLER